MSQVLAFWAAALLVAVAALPITFALLRRLPDAGTGLSFAAGLLLSGWTYFILRTASVLPPGRGGYLLAVAAVAIVSAAVAGRDRRFAGTVRFQWPSLIAVAGLFTLFFFGYVAFRGYNPEIVGTEQPMDFLYLNATLESDDYPPRDPWLAGKRASYYYFGYLQVGLLTRLADVPSSIGYNLGLAYTFAASATGIASLAVALGRWVFGPRLRVWAPGAAVAAIVLLLAVGSLSAIFEWSAAHERYNERLYRWMGVEWLLPCEIGDPATECYEGPAGQPRTDSWYPTEFWFWWRGSRIIPGTITEFPFFSFLLGDLHPHVMAIPVVLLALGLALAWWRGRRRLDWRTHVRAPWPGIAVALVLGGLAFQNTWDVITFCCVFAGAVLLRNLRRERALPAIGNSLTYLAPVFVLAVIAYLPWYLTFSSQASGLYAYVGEGTRPAHAFLQFGPLLAAALVALTWALRGTNPRVLLDSLAFALPAPLLPFLGWALLAAARGDLHNGFEARGAGGWVTLAAYGVATWLLAGATIATAWRRSAAAGVVALAGVGALLLYGAELFLIKDIFFDSAPRLNTVFKLSYQAWVLLSLAGGVALAVAVRRAMQLRPTFAWLAAPALVLVAAGLVYPLIAMPNRTNGFSSSGDNTADGLAFLARNDPDEYALTRWIADHTNAGDVVIETTGRRYAVGEDGQVRLVDASVDYSDAGRIAARTGSSTPIGWYFHEVQWRGVSAANNEQFSARQEMVDAVYLNDDPADVLRLMRRLDAEFVVVGREELRRYPREHMTPFDTFLDTVFESGDLRVYRLPRYEVVETS